MIDTVAAVSRSECSKVAAVCHAEYCEPIYMERDRERNRDSEGEGEGEGERGRAVMTFFLLDRNSGRCHAEYEYCVSMSTFLLVSVSFTED